MDIHLTSVISVSRKEKLDCKEMSNYFPEGSDTPPSEASSDIWLDPEGFKIAIKNFELASLELITQSQSENFDMTVNSFRDLAQTCKSCHQKFRN